jgi:predicted phosphodiesterase
LANWTPAEVALLQEYVQQGVGFDGIVERFAARGIPRTYKSIQRKAQQERNRAPDVWRVRLPRSTTRRYNAPLEVQGDAVILADIHAPFHDADWLDRVVSLALKRNVRQAVLAGDFADFNAFSSYGRDVGIDADAELDTLAALMDALIATFERVYYIAGNHDVRPLRVLGDVGLSVTSLMRLFAPRPDDKQFFTSDYHWCRLVSGGQTYQIEHPKNASVNAAFVPRKLAGKFGCHVIGAHGHTWGMTKDDSGRYWAIDSGVCADPLRLGYTQLVHSTRPVQMQGAVIVQGGLPLLLSPETIGMY